MKTMRVPGLRLSLSLLASLAPVPALAQGGGDLDPVVEWSAATPGITYATSLSAQNGTLSYDIGADGTVLLHVIVVEEGERTGRLRALDSETGAHKWDYRGQSNRRLSYGRGGDGTIYLTRDATLISLDPDSGETRWETTPRSGNELRVPRESGGRVYVTSNRTLYAVDAADGDVLWDFEHAQGDSNNNQQDDESLSTPLIGEDGTVFVGSRRRISAVNGVTGAEIWTSRAEGDRDYGTIVLGPDDSVYVTLRGRVQALNGATGALRWETGGSNNGRLGNLAVGSDNNVYYTRNKRLFCLNGATGAQRWTYSAKKSLRGLNLSPNGTPVIASGRVLVALNAANGNTRWTFSPQTRLLSAPSFGPNGTVYVTSIRQNLDEGMLFAVNGLTGEVEWQFRQAFWEPVPPAIGPDAVYAGTQEGRVFAVAAPGVPVPARQRTEQTLTDDTAPIPFPPPNARPEHFPLDLRRDGEDLLLSWPVGSPAVLESSTGLGPEARWREAEDAHDIVDGVARLRLADPLGQRFYRLRW